MDGITFLIERLTPLAQQLNSLDIEKIGNICVKKTPELVKVKYVSLYVIDGRGNILRLQKCNHPYPVNRIVSLNQDPPTPMVLAVKRKELIIIEDIDTHKEPVITKSQRAFAEKYGTKNCALAPLICHGKVVGVLNLADKEDGSHFTQDDIALIELFRQLIGASVGNIRMFEKIQVQAMTDGLTGLANHRTFYDVLEKELWRARRYGGKIALIMVDIDNLKSINDIYGHYAGDKVIKGVSGKIRGCIRQVDTAARYGGDEFAVILPGTSIDDALVVAKRMVSSVSGMAVEWKQERISPTISVGLGEYEPDMSPEIMTNCSDAALYVAKHAGKNTVRIF